MTDLFVEPEGATPLDHEDLLGLRRTDITFRHELNRAEAENIAAAQLWSFGRRRALATWLTQPQMKAIHKRMFGDVWRWAGSFRRRETSIGIDPYRIAVELENLLLNTVAQAADPARLAWPADEIAVRFHHRLVFIHPFPNGNGRHARLAADVVAVNLGRPRFSWGSAGHLTENSTARATYLSALRTADRNHEYGPLLQFARG